MTRTQFWIGALLLGTFFWYTSRDTARQMEKEQECIEKAANRIEVERCFDMMKSHMGKK